MNWVKKSKLLATKTIKFNEHLYIELCIELDNLWQALYQTFNSAQDQHINFHLLDKIPL